MDPPSIRRRDGSAAKRDETLPSGKGWRPKREAFTLAKFSVGYQELLFSCLKAVTQTLQAQTLTPNASMA